MINRNIFLKKNYDKYMTFLDDDDFSNSIDDRVKSFDYYRSFIETRFQQNKNEAFKFLKLINKNHKALHAKSLEEFRKDVYPLFKQQVKGYRLKLMEEVFKYGIYKQRSIVKTEETSFGHSTVSYQKSVHCCGLWSAIIPPYLPKNFMNVQEMSSDDVGYMRAHDAFNHNLPRTISAVYYYISSGHQGYGYINEDARSEWKTIQRERIHALEKYIKEGKVLDNLNYGRYWFRYDSEIETSLGLMKFC
jgi:hypothetical protein